MGGGLALSAACDLRVCTPDAQFGLPIARTLGNCLSMENYARLAALLGPARPKDIMFTARTIERRGGARRRAGHGGGRGRRGARGGAVRAARGPCGRHAAGDQGGAAPPARGGPTATTSCARPRSEDFRRPVAGFLAKGRSIDARGCRDLQLAGVAPRLAGSRSARPPSSAQLRADGAGDVPGWSAPATAPAAARRRASRGGGAQGGGARRGARAADSLRICEGSRRRSRPVLRRRAVVGEQVAHGQRAARPAGSSHLATGRPVPRSGGGRSGRGRGQRAVHERRGRRVAALEETLRRPVRPGLAEHRRRRVDRHHGADARGQPRARRTRVPAATSSARSSALVRQARELHSASVVKMQL